MAAEAFLIGEQFIGRDNVSLILGDNIFSGYQLGSRLKEASKKHQGATVFAYNVTNPKDYGIINVDQNLKPLSIVEKPKKPKSNWAVTGLYYYDNSVIDIAKKLKPSARGELEITDINKAYLKKKKLHVEFLGRGYAWLDTGTYDSLIDASMFIKTIEERQGLKIGCIEEIAFHKKLINAKQLKQLARRINTDYGTYLKKVADHAL